MKTMNKLLHILFGTLTALALGPFGGSAQACEATMATSLYQEGKALLEKDDITGARAKFDAAFQCNPTLNEALIVVGKCDQKVGRLGSALSSFSEAKRREEIAGHPERAQKVGLMVKEVEPLVPHLLINASEQVKATPGLKVTLNNDPVLPATFGVDRRPDPGSYELVVTADQREPWKTTLTLAEKESKVVELQLGQPLQLAPPPPPTIQPAPAQVPPPPRQEPVEAADPGATQRTLGLIAGGLGIVGIGFGSFEGLSAVGKNNDSKDHCNAQNQCDDAGLTLRSDAIDAANLSTIGFVAGGALLAGGAFLYFTAPSADDPPATTGLWIGPSSVSLRGAF